MSATIDGRVHVWWAPEITGPARWEHLPAPTIDGEWFVDPALDGLACAPRGEVRYTARDGHRVCVVKGNPPGPGQRRLF